MVSCEREHDKIENQHTHTHHIFSHIFFAHLQFETQLERKEKLQICIN